MKRIVLAGGCFWGVEAYFQQLKGVSKTRVGYANGNFANPKYEDLLAHKATHAEAVDITYDENDISLDTLLSHMFRFIDPTILDRQGHDIGHQYRTGVYYVDESDLPVIKSFMSKQQPFYKKPIVVEVLPLQGFYDAEEYHQDYLLKNPFGYCHVDLRLIKPGEKK